MNSFKIPFHIENRYFDGDKPNVLVDDGIQDYEILNEDGSFQLCKTQFQGHFYYAVCRDRKEQIYATSNLRNAEDLFDELS
mgnify:CR=1 FL=1